MAEGTADTDAVNVSQLKRVQSVATTKVIAGKNMVVTITVNSDGSKNYQVSTADDMNFNSVKMGNTLINNQGVNVGNKVSLTENGLKAGNVSVTTKGMIKISVPNLKVIP